MLRLPLLLNHVISHNRGLHHVFQDARLPTACRLALTARRIRHLDGADALPVAHEPFQPCPRHSRLADVPVCCCRAA